MIYQWFLCWMFVCTIVECSLVEIRRGLIQDHRHRNRLSDENDVNNSKIFRLMGRYSRMSSLKKAENKLKPKNVKHLIVDMNDVQQVNKAEEKVMQSIMQLKNYSCTVPRPKIVDVQVKFATHRLIPPAVVLHRCSDTLLCCGDIFQKCRPKEKQKVVMVFKTLDVKFTTGYMKLKLTNHTQCHCVQK